MLELDAAAYSRVLLVFAQMTRLTWQLSGVSPAARLDAAAKAGVLTNLANLLGVVEPMGARLTASATRKLIEMIGRDEEPYASLIAQRLSEIESRFVDELESTKMFVVLDAKARFFRDGDGFFNADARLRFESAIFDVEEAGRCFSLDRYTACVFHIMRAAEAVIATLAHRIEATVLDQHGQTLPWGILAANIGAVISKMPQGREKDRWHEAHMFLVSCNRAFRTKTAHPVETYTEEQALAAYEATRAFKRSSAALMA